MLCGKPLNKRVAAEIDPTDAALCEYCRREWQKRQKGK